MSTITNKRLVYIIGSARSGTTLLDILLGNSKNAVSLGELNRFTTRNGFPPLREPTSEAYAYWSNFRSSLPAKYFDADKSLRSLDSIVKKVEHYKAPLYWLFMKKESIRRYKDYISDFYELIDRQTDGEVLIESSKYPFRALRISGILKGEIDFIYIRKDPAAVVNSFRKADIEQPSKSYIGANLYYFISNFFCSIVVMLLRKRGFKVFKVKYEELISHPDLFIEKIGLSLNIDTDMLSSKIKNREALNVGHLFDGNRIRLKDQITLNEDFSRRSSFKDRISRLINYPLY